MKKSFGKYSVSESTGEVLHNLLGITDPEKLADAETEGLIFAEITFREKLSTNTRFDLAYVMSIHRVAFAGIYSFAGRLRDENISKDDFLFPAARFLPSNLVDFEKDFLLPYHRQYANEAEWLDTVATIHAELLYLHPFREGNGRTARMFADLMSIQYREYPFDFAALMEKKRDDYIAAVQAVVNRDYEPMKALFRLSA